MGENTSIAVSGFHSGSLQGRKEETLQKLLAIAGEEWSLPKGNLLQRLQLLQLLQHSRHSPCSGAEKPVRTRRQKVKFSCPEPEGHFAAPDSCKLYYQCVHGRPSQHRCGQGLVWNTETGQCDWEDTSSCRALDRRPRTPPDPQLSWEPEALICI